MLLWYILPAVCWLCIDVWLYLLGLGGHCGAAANCLGFAVAVCVVAVRFVVLGVLV